MKNKYTLLRHAVTVKDPNKPVIEWDLTPDALIKINEYISEGKFDGITKIISSTESKAISTAKPILEYLNTNIFVNEDQKITIETLEEFVEVKREKRFLTDEEFLDQKKRELTNLDQVENGVESANQALKRFESGVQKLEEQHLGENILIITHGTIMTLYLAKINHDLESVFARWEKLKFCELVRI